MKMQNGETSMTFTVIVALFSGIIGVFVSPFFNQKLANEEFRVNQIEEIATNLQRSHMEMSLQAWRLTIANKATREELNDIHDKWLFSHRETTKWLEVAKEYFPDDEVMLEYSESIHDFYELETTQFGLADSLNSQKGQKLITAFEGSYLALRRHIYEATKVSIFN